MLGGREDRFIEEAGNLGEKGTHVPKNQLPIDDQGTSVFKGEFQGCTGRGGVGATCRTTQSVPTFILKFVVW